MICLDELGPESAKTFAGQQAIDVTARPARRAKREMDYGRRGKGYIFGAFRPATGEAFTRDYGGRTIANWIDFLEQVDAWLPAEEERVYAIVDNLSAHHADDVLLFSLTHPRLRVRLPAGLCRLSQSHRAVVESVALARLYGAAVRGLGGNRGCRPRRHRLLECP